MERSFDLGAIILYIIFAFTVFYLIYLLFDVKNIFGKLKKHEYILGHPEHKNLKSSEGIIIVTDDDVTFKDLVGDEVFFSVPLKQINRVSTSHEGASSSNRIFKGVSNLFAERDYLFIDFLQDSKEHTLQFSVHRSSSVNDEVKKKILKAKNRIRNL